MIRDKCEPLKPGKFAACSDSGTDTRAPVWYKCSVDKHLRHHRGPYVTTDTVPQTVLFRDLFDKPLHAQFNQEQASSDGGAVLLKGAVGRSSVAPPADGGSAGRCFSRASAAHFRMRRAPVYAASVPV